MTPIVNGVKVVPNMGRSGWLTEAWLLFKQDAGAWAGAAFTAGVLSLIVAFALTLAVEIPAGIFRGIFRGHPGATPRVFPLWAYPALFVVSILNLFAYSYFGAGALKMAIASVRREPIRVELIFSGLSHMMSLFKYNVGFTATYSLLMMIPQMLMLRTTITPGVLPWGLYAIMATFGFVMGLVYLFILPGDALVIDGVPVKESLARSFAAVGRNFWHVLGVAIVLFLLYILAICTCGLGLIIWVPLVALVMALAARDIGGLPVVVAPPTYAPDPTFPGAWPPPPGAWPPPPTAPQPPATPHLEPIADPHPTPPVNPPSDTETVDQPQDEQNDSIG